MVHVAFVIVEDDQYTLRIALRLSLPKANCGVSYGVYSLPSAMTKRRKL